MQICRYYPFRVATGVGIKGWPGTGQGVGQGRGLRRGQVRGTLYTKATASSVQFKQQGAMNEFVMTGE